MALGIPHALVEPLCLHPALPLSPFLLDADHFRKGIRGRRDLRQQCVPHHHAELGHATHPGKAGMALLICLFGLAAPDGAPCAAEGPPGHAA